MGASGCAARLADLTRVLLCIATMKTQVWTAKKVAALRAAAGMTQEQFADWLGVTRGHVSHLEMGIMPAGTQTARLLDILAKMQSGELKAVQPQKRRKAR